MIEKNWLNLVNIQSDIIFNTYLLYDHKPMNLFSVLLYINKIEKHEFRILKFCIHPMHFISNCFVQNLKLRFIPFLQL